MTPNNTHSRASETRIFTDQAWNLSNIMFSTVKALYKISTILSNANNIVDINNIAKTIVELEKLMSSYSKFLELLNPNRTVIIPSEERKKGTTNATQTLLNSILEQASTLSTNLQKIQDNPMIRQVLDASKLMVNIHALNKFLEYANKEYSKNSADPRIYAALTLVMLALTFLIAIPISVRL